MCRSRVNPRSVRLLRMRFVGFKLPYGRDGLSALALFALPAKHLPLFSVQTLGVSLLGALDGPRGALDGSGLRLRIRKTNADKETEAQQRDQSIHDFLRREVRVPA
jgi:hypothetical protein